MTGVFSVIPANLDRRSGQAQESFYGAKGLRPHLDDHRSSLPPGLKPAPDFDPGFRGDRVILVNRTKELAIALEQGGFGNMICTGDLVQDWQGRAGIAVATADPPATDKFRPILGSNFDELPEKTTWWSVALFSGAVVNSPTPLTYSWGRASRAILLMATRRCEDSVRGRLAELVELEESGKGAECSK